MAVVTLPSKRDVLAEILSDSTERKDVSSEAWDKAIEWALFHYGDSSSLEELVENEDWYKVQMSAFVDGYLAGSKK